MKYPAKVIIATGTFMNITVEIEIDTEKMDESKAIVKALYKHFHGILENQAITNNLLNQLNAKSNTKANSELDVVYDMEE